MIYSFKGPFSYDRDTVEDWDNDSMGVYYVGKKNDKNALVIFYIGRAITDGGIRDRLLQHLGESKWYDATYFGYHICGTSQEAIDWEKEEIVRYNPKYNVVGTR